VVRTVKVPVIGVGGITCAEDALEFLIVGARAVQVGTANFVNPRVMPRIVAGLERYCREQQVEDINQVIGSLQLP
jgi:dihydroorotate dehydrogenase (NAD+) catalytic subunit